MPRVKQFLLFILAIAVGPVATLSAAPVDPAVPFSTSNQNPLVAVYGLPSAGPAKVLALGKTAVEMRADIASVCSRDDQSGENILLDGESYRFTLALQQGLGERFEVGLEIPPMSCIGKVFSTALSSTGMISFISPKGSGMTCHAIAWPTTTSRMAAPRSI
jgi:hypothetical protein